MSEEQNRFSLRKLSVGLASVLIGVSIFGTSQTVKADTVADNQTSSVTNNAQSSDTQENKNVAKSTFSSITPYNNVKSNLIQTQDKAKNDQTDSLNQNPTNSQEANDSNDLQEKSAEKSIVSPNSAQKINNQSNDHAEDNSQPQNEQKLDITKNSKKLAKKVLATNLTQDNSTQKDYTPDINAWTGHDDGTYYILDTYTPQNNFEKDLVVIPNEADFEKAGKSTNGHEIGIAGYNMRNIVLAYNPKEIHFSETDNRKIKALDSNWGHAFSINNYNEAITKHSRLESVTGKTFDASRISDVNALFYYDQRLNNISALSTWNNAKFTDLSNIFLNCTSLSDISLLINWNISNVQHLGHAFSGTNITSIDALSNWNTSKVKYFDNTFRDCPNLINIDAVNNWNYSSAQVAVGFGNYPLDDTFYGDHKIKINIGTDSGLADFIRRTGRIDAFHNSSDQITTSNTKLIELLTNADLNAQNETATAKRTITFTGLPANRAIPPIVQVINYTKLTTAIIDMTGTSDANPIGKIVNAGFSDGYQLDTSKQNDDVIIDGVVYFKPVKIPHVNGYKAHLVRNKLNPAMLMVSFIAVPTENKPSTPVEVAPSKPSANADNPNHSAWTNLDHKVVDVLNQSDSGWTMPNTQPATYTVEVPADDAIIDLSDLVIAEPVHAQTRVKIRVNKRFKLSKKHSLKHFKHRKKAVRTFKKYRL